jgi:purine-binding chemotaxis protein CheW
MAGMPNPDVTDDDDLKEEDAQKGKYLTFRVGNEDFGIAIEHVTEIVGIQRITTVPDLPGFVRGVINLRGRVIPVVDVRVRFRLETRPYDDRTCVVVVKLNDLDVGLIVDTVNEVLAIPTDQVMPPPKVRQSLTSRFVVGIGRVGESVLILLDVGKLLLDEELNAIEAGKAPDAPAS